MTSGEILEAIKSDLNWLSRTTDLGKVVEVTERPRTIVEDLREDAEHLELPLDLLVKFHEAALREDFSLGIAQKLVNDHFDVGKTLEMDYWDLNLEYSSKLCRYWHMMFDPHNKEVREEWEEEKTD
jgi:hypothetical protein